MKHYNFKHTPDKLPDNCGIGWLLNNKIRDKAIEGATQNLLDFYSFKYRKIPQVASHEFIELCNMALDNGFEKLLIFKQGSILGNFIEHSKEFWNTDYKDCVLVGHILDRGNEWWQIHPQTLYIDLIWWKESGKLEFGDKETNVTWSAPNIERSNETLQSEETYNPTWIKSAEGVSTVENRWEGWNLLNAAMAQNKKVGIWNPKLRKAKSYVYGEMLDHYEKVHNIGKELWVSRWFAANTETMDNIIQEQQTSAVYSTSGGVSPLSNAYIRNLKPGGELVCFDIDPLALHMQQYVFNNWNGRNWKQFVTDYAEQNPILGNKFACMEALDLVDEYITALGAPFQEWWNTTAKTFNVKFLEIDIMNICAMSDHLEHQDNGDKVFIDVSNAFNYEVNAILYSKNIRLNLEADYIKFFENDKDRYITKGFDINMVNLDPKFSYLPKLFPWQKF